MRKLLCGAALYIHPHAWLRKIVRITRNLHQSLRHLQMGCLIFKKSQLKLPIWQHFNITNFKRSSGKNITLSLLLLILWKIGRTYFLENTGEKELGQIFKLVFVLSHGQSYVERGFSANKELIDTNINDATSCSKAYLWQALKWRLKVLWFCYYSKLEKKLHAC